MNRIAPVVWIVALALTAAFLAIWEYAVATRPEAAFFFSRPSAVFAELVNYARSGELWIDGAYTGAPAILGLLAGASIGGALGSVFAAAPRATAALRPILAGLASFPVFVLAPMTLLWFGADLMSGKVFLAFVSCVFVFLNAAHQGGVAAPEPLVRHLRVNGFGPWGEFVKLRLPYALDRFILALPAGANLALLGVFIGEYVIAEHGLAKTMLIEAGRYNMARVLAAAAVFTGLAAVLGLSAAALRTRRDMLLRFFSVAARTKHLRRE